MRIMTFRAPDWMFDYLEQAKKESGHKRNGLLLSIIIDWKKRQEKSAG